MTKKRNVHRIVIKNFGPIKDVDMEVAGVNVLIGDNGTGKSYISKLIYMFNMFFQKLLLFVDYKYQLKYLSQEKYIKYKFKKINHKLIDVLKWVLNELFYNNSSDFLDRIDLFYIEYHYTDSKKLVFIKRENNIECSISDDLQNDIENFFVAYDRICEKPDNSEIEKGGVFNPYPPNDYAVIEESKEKYNLIYILLLNISTTKYNAFAPINRIEYVLHPKTYSSRYKFIPLLNLQIGNFIIRDFVLDYELLKTHLSNFLNTENISTVVVKNIIKITQKFQKESVELLKGKYLFEKNNEYLCLSDGKRVSLEMVSSGQIELIALLSFIISLFTSGLEYENGEFLVFEEPEAHLFPTTQKKLMELMVFAYNQNPGNRVLINTHSPYILTALNNLIQAKNTADAQPDKIADIEKIIPKGKWLNYDDVRVYEMKDGTLRLLMDEETQLIDADPIDVASTLVNEEYYGLLDLKYGDDDDTDD